MTYEIQVLTTKSGILTLTYNDQDSIEEFQDQIKKFHGDFVQIKCNPVKS